jgi:hypothetical protein
MGNFIFRSTIMFRSPSIIHSGMGMIMFRSTTDGIRRLSFRGGMNQTDIFQIRLRPHTLVNTGSRPISEVKLVLAQLVLGWGTTWEYCVL